MRGVYARAAARLRESSQSLGDDDDPIVEDDDFVAPDAVPAAASPALVPAPAPPEPPTAEIIPPTPLVRPEGDAAQLLEHQLGTCAALIGNIADYIMRASSDPDVCLNFMDRITSMVKSSAAAGKVVGRLRADGPDETRHRVIVEHAAPPAPQGEGVLRA